MDNPKQKERALFLSLWLVIIVVGAIFYFALGTPKPKRYAPPLSLSLELGRMFETGAVVDFSPTQYHLELKVRSEYRGELPDSEKSFPLGFRFEVAGNVIDSGLTKCVIKKDEPTARMTLDNPNRVIAHKIELRLAH